MSRSRHAASATGVALFVGALLCGCGTSSTITQGPNPIKCGVTFATPPALDAAGGAGSLAVTTQPECAWDATTTTNWISGLSPTSGQGPATISFRVAANDGGSSRDGVIVVNGEQARVSQRAPCRYDVSPSTYGTGASGGSSTLSVAAANDCAWTASSNVSWITVTPPASGSGNGSVGFLVAPNRDIARSGSIVVATQRVAVSQAAGDPPPAPPPTPPPAPPSPPPPPACTYSLSRNADFVGFQDGNGGVGVTTTSVCRWTAVSNASWLFIASGASGTGTGFVEYRYLTNPTRTQRTGTLTIAGLTYTVTQPGIP